MSVAPDTDYAKTGFLKRIAHELRGPAGIVQMVIDELEVALGDDLERHRILLTKGRSGVSRVLRVAERLDKTAELVAGEAQFTMAPSDLAQSLRAAAGRAEALEGKRKVGVVVQAPDALPWMLDSQWMDIALAELASNAIRHARKRVEVSLSVSGDEATILFADDNDAAELFGPVRFQQIRERRGLGVGLALAQDAILAHGGRLDIRIDPTADLRTRVSVILPRTRRASDPSAGGGGIHENSRS